MYVISKVCYEDFFFLLWILNVSFKTFEDLLMLILNLYIKKVINDYNPNFLMLVKPMVS